ncbi:hypothetical protein PGT21_022541 [Puccinia graminis f. sp. tritici]|uniref:Uncharacterized protein n=1 Tax=Puccinia graminis f. sp. tritici TaxID=56615 RepID=A0A5B0LQJ7_PUCGR|nr:hypothetical protein PGT21_022541 [Puccinia graminis f. sp. tritici]
MECHPLPSTSQLQATAGSSSISNRTLSTNDRSELPTSNHSNKPEFSTPPSSQMEDNNPQTSAKVQSPQTKISGTGYCRDLLRLARIPSQGFYHPFKARAIVTEKTYFRTLHKPTTASTTPNLHRKFSAKFLRRRSPRPVHHRPSNHRPRTADPSPRSSPTVGGNESGRQDSDQDRVSKALRNPSCPPLPSAHPLSPHSDPIRLTNSLTTTTTFLFAPETTNLGSYRHSLSTRLDHPNPWDELECTPPRSLPVTGKLDPLPPPPPFDKIILLLNSSSSNRLAAQFKFSRTLSPVESHTNNRSHPPLEPPSLSPHYKGIISPTNVTNQERQMITSPSSSASRKSFGSVAGTQAPPPSAASSHYLHHSLPKLGRTHSASLRSSLTHTPNPNPVSLPHSLPTSNPNQNSNLDSNVKANRISASLANRPSSAKRPSIIGPALAPTHKPAAGSLGLLT